MGAKEFLANIPRKYVPEVQKCINHVAEVLAPPTNSDEANEAAARELADIQRKVGGDSTTALADQIREDLRRHLRLQGIPDGEFPAYVRPRMIRIFKMANGFRNNYHSPRAAEAKPWINKTLYGIEGMPQLIMAAVAAVLIFAWTTGKQQAEQFQIGLKNMEQKITADSSLRAIYVSSSQFKSMTEALTPSYDVRQAQAAAVPMTLSAVAAEPVQVEVRDASGGDVVLRTSSVRGVYNALPEPAQEQMQREAISCRREHNRTITVRSPVGTATISGFFGKSGNDC